jgi:hypothetical protein
MKRTTYLTVLALLVLSVSPTAFAVNNKDLARAEVSDSATVESTGDFVKSRARLLEDQTEEGEKTKLREEIVEKVKTKAELAIQAAVNRYNRVRTQVQNSNLTDEEKSAINATLDAQIQALNTLRNEVQVAQDVDEVKNVMTKLKTQYKYSLGLVRQAIKGVYEDRLSNIAEKIQIPYEKLLERVGALQDSGVKTDLLSKLTAVNDLIVSAQDKIIAGELDSAKDDLASARTILVSVVTALNN